jgi:hypothetical protein
MYSTKLINNHIVDKNAYITVGDPYQDPNLNPFRESKPLKKGEKGPIAFRVQVKLYNKYILKLFKISIYRELPKMLKMDASQNLNIKEGMHKKYFNILKLNH